MRTRFPWSSVREAVFCRCFWGFAMNDLSKQPASSWLDFSLMGVGFWMLFSPATLDFSAARPDSWLIVLAALLVIGLAFSLRRAFHNWEAWAVAALGGILVVLPWIAGFQGGAGATANAVICGILIAILAVGRWYAHGHGMDEGPAAPPTTA